MTHPEEFLETLLIYGSAKNLRWQPPTLTPPSSPTNRAEPSTKPPTEVLTELPHRRYLSNQLVKSHIWTWPGHQQDHHQQISRRYFSPPSVSSYRVDQRRCPPHELRLEWQLDLWATSPISSPPWKAFLNILTNVQTQLPTESSPKSPTDVPTTYYRRYLTYQTRLEWQLGWRITIYTWSSPGMALLHNTTNSLTLLPIVSLSRRSTNIPMILRDPSHPIGLQEISHGSVDGSLCLCTTEKVPSQEQWVTIYPEHQHVWVLQTTNSWEKVWWLSHKDANRLCHAINGNSVEPSQHQPRTRGKVPDPEKGQDP
jgi:hypothetical protein